MSKKITLNSKDYTTEFGSLYDTENTKTILSSEPEAMTFQIITDNSTTDPTTTLGQQSEPQPLLEDKNSADFLPNSIVSEEISDHQFRRGNQLEQAQIINRISTKESKVAFSYIWNLPSTDYDIDFIFNLLCVLPLKVLKDELVRVVSTAHHYEFDQWSESVVEFEQLLQVHQSDLAFDFKSSLFANLVVVGGGVHNRPNKEKAQSFLHKLMDDDFFHGGSFRANCWNMNLAEELDFIWQAFNKLPTESLKREAIVSIGGADFNSFRLEANLEKWAAAKIEFAKLLKINEPEFLKDFQKYAFRQLLDEFFRDDCLDKEAAKNLIAKFFSDEFAEDLVQNSPFKIHDPIFTIFDNEPELFWDCFDNLNNKNIKTKIAKYIISKKPSGVNFSELIAKKIEFCSILVLTEPYLVDECKLRLSYYLTDAIFKRRSEEEATEAKYHFLMLIKKGFLPSNLIDSGFFLPGSIKTAQLVQICDLLSPDFVQVLPALHDECLGYLIKGIFNSDYNVTKSLGLLP